MSRSTSTYSVDPAPIFLFSYVAGSLACSALVVLLALIDPSFQRAGAPAVLQTIGYVLVFFGPPYAAICALTLARQFKYEVTPEGVVCRGLLGRPSIVLWNDIAATRPIKVGNLEFVRLIPRSPGAAIWLPLFVRGGSTGDGATFLWAERRPTEPARNAGVLDRTNA